VLAGRVLGEHDDPVLARGTSWHPRTVGRVETAAQITITESTLGAFFAEASAAAEEPLPTVTVELRALGDRLTFLLPGTGTAGAITTANGYALTIGTDATIDVTTGDGTTYSGLGRLVDDGDRGDTDNYDPPLRDELVTPWVRSATAHTSTVRTRLEITRPWTCRTRSQRTGTDSRLNAPRCP